MTRKLFFISSIILFLIGCNSCDSIKGNDSTSHVQIRRFDKELYEWISTDNATKLYQIRSDYASLLKTIGMGVFKTQETHTDAFFNRMINYYSEPTLNQLYQDALSKFEYTDNISEELSIAFGYLQKHFPEMQIPAVYMHVSGLQQNVLVDDSLLSISIDKYLGEDYPIYQGYFYAHQRRKMAPTYVVPDYLAAWLMSEYPFSGDDRILLDRMIYEGKIKYLVHQASSKLLPEVLMGYTPEEYQWCKQNEKALWEEIIKRKHLYTPDHVTTSKYFSSTPARFISDFAPGEIGNWIGWQIVSNYMKRNKVTPEELMENNDYQDILAKSKYKP